MCIPKIGMCSYIIAVTKPIVLPGFPLRGRMLNSVVAYFIKTRWIEYGKSWQWDIYYLDQHQLYFNKPMNYQQWTPFITVRHGVIKPVPNLPEESLWDKPNLPRNVSRTNGGTLHWSMLVNVLGGPNNTNWNNHRPSRLNITLTENEFHPIRS